MIGAANATAVAGGFELLLAATWWSPRRRPGFGLPEVKRGLFAGGGGTFLGNRIPLGVALEMALTGDPIDAERAYELGLVNAVVAPDQVLDAALGHRRADRRQRPAGGWPRPRNWSGSVSPTPLWPRSGWAS